MKIQLFILGLLVIATLAHSRTDGDDESRIGLRRNCERRRRNNNEISANAQDADSDDTIPPEDASNVQQESRSRHRCGSKRGGSRRDGLRHNSEWQKENGVDNNEDHLTHNQEWHEKHGVPMPENNNGAERKHHRHPHRHHHHHHHHRNRTTSTSTTTSTSAPSFSEDE